MAKSKATKKTKKYRQYKKKGKKATVNRDVVTLGKGFPKRLVVTHKYAEAVSLTSTSGVMNQYHFCANGIYDPNLSGGGHKGYLFNQCSALYDHYTVIGSKVTFKVLNGASNTGLIGIAAFINDDTSMTATNLQNAIEQNTAVRAFIPYGASSPLNLKLKWSAKKYFGKGVLANNDLQGTVSANPTEQSVYTICAQCLDGATTISVYIEAVIEYIVVWTEIKDIASS